MKKRLAMLLVMMTCVVLLSAIYKDPQSADAASTTVYRGEPIISISSEKPKEVFAEEIVEPEIKEAKTTTMYVKASALNVRKSPAGEIHKTVPFNTELEVIEHLNNGWTSISHDGSILYVKTEHLSDTKAEQAPTPRPNMVLWKSNVKLTYYHAKGKDAHDNQLDPNYTVASNVLPQYTKLYIEGIGYRTVMDTGSSVLNDGRVDICCPTYNNKDCLAYSSKMPQRANVYIVTD